MNRSIISISTRDMEEVDLEDQLVYLPGHDALDEVRRLSEVWAQERGLEEVN